MIKQHKRCRNILLIIISLGVLSLLLSTVLPRFKDTADKSTQQNTDTYSKAVKPISSDKEAEANKKTDANKDVDANKEAEGNSQENGRYDPATEGNNQRSEGESTEADSKNPVTEENRSVAEGDEATDVQLTPEELSSSDTSNIGETAASQASIDKGQASDRDNGQDSVVDRGQTSEDNNGRPIETEKGQVSKDNSEQDSDPGGVSSDEEGKLIVIDAGHQSKGNYGYEPIGPGADTKKPKVSSGTSGISTGQKEYELNLTVAIKLKEELLARGYRVMMIRETHEVDIPNSERAAIANEANADAFLRIHANSSENQKVKGVLTISQTKSNPYNADLYQINKSLSQKVLKHIVQETGAENKGVWETDTMSGINWCKVPVTIIEMGYMSNKEEDELLAKESYQDKIVLGIADGLDDFFSKTE